jgi:hypothetical protein
MTPQRRVPPLVLGGLLGLVLFQAWAYAARLPLSLGPRVILQPWLLQRGFVLYENIADLHSPLLSLLLAAWVPWVPDGLALAKGALVALLTLTTLLTFVVAWRKVGWPAGLWAAGFVVVWSPAFGFGKLWYETLLAPLYLLLLLVYEAPGSPRPGGRSFLLGLLCGGAILVKQHAALVTLALLGWSAFANWISHRSLPNALRQIGLMALGTGLPIAAYVAYHYAQAGTLEGFLFWTVSYNLAGDYESLAALPPTAGLIARFVSSCLLLPAAVCDLVDSIRRGDRTWPWQGWALVLLAAASVTIYPRFAAFHLQAALPVLAVVSSLGLAWLWRIRGRGRLLATGIAVAVSALWLIVAIPDYKPVLDTSSPQQIWEYSDLLPLAREIRQQIGPEGCAYLFPDDEAAANLYYLLGCSPPNFWIFHYPWYMLDWVQARILLSLQAHPPEWVVYRPGRWNIEQYAPDIVGYLQAHYQREASFQWTQGEAWLLRRVPGQ